MSNDLANFVLAALHGLAHPADHLLIGALDGLTKAAPGRAGEIVELILKKTNLVPARMNSASGRKPCPEGIDVLGVGIQISPPCSVRLYTRRSACCSERTCPSSSRYCIVG
ncbi:MAG TPA: hypothetical protein VK604_02445 [Bryobacteraceae bacterium]|nr:hypothetical protein [Bryobacteraceae bacterium]